jgi:hypothetical protein
MCSLALLMLCTRQSGLGQASNHVAKKSESKVRFEQGASVAQMLKVCAVLCCAARDVLCCAILPDHRT